MLVKNAQNLMRAVIRTVHAAEAACMKVVLSFCVIINFTKQTLSGIECSGGR